MKVKNCLVVLCLAVLFFSVTSCGAKKNAKEPSKSDTAITSETSRPPVGSPSTSQLPVRYQSPGYVTPKETVAESLGEKADDYQMKVGASINSRGLPLELGKTLETLARLKGMNVSWASDTNQYAQVSVNISPDENFADAIRNLLRQVDHYYEIKGKTIYVRDKETKTFQLGVPSMKGEYTSSVGGNFLASRDAKSGTEGNVKIKSDGNKFDVWENVEKNLSIILAIVEEGEKFVAKEEGKIESDREASAKNALLTDANTVKVSGYGAKSGDSNVNDKRTTEANKESSKQFKYSNRHTSQQGEYFVIDKSIGLITVTAKPVNMSRVEEYINRLKKELFRQISLEAKIIEVVLSKNSNLGIDWKSVLKNLPVTGTVGFGNSGQVYPHLPDSSGTYAGTFVSNVKIDPIDLGVLMSAFDEQGDTHVLANPKLTVLNGQPALISVGKDIAYVKKMTKTTTVGTTGNTDTYTAEPDNVVAGIALGVMASVLDEKRIILNLTPITTDIDNLAADGSVKTTKLGDGSIELGLPQVRIREMSTLVQVEDGEMLIIGGLIDSIETNTNSSLPGLGSVPVLKYLFGAEGKSKTKRELVVLLTPKII